MMRCCVKSLHKDPKAAKAIDADALGNAWSFAEPSRDTPHALACTSASLHGSKVGHLMRSHSGLLWAARRFYLYNFYLPDWHFMSHLFFSCIP